MSTDKVKKSKDELTDKEMDKVSGGGDNTTTSKPSVSEISVTKRTDIASAKLS
jgi:bacteriocin-like protein